MPSGELSYEGLEFIIFQWSIGNYRLKANKGLLRFPTAPLLLKLYCGVESQTIKFIHISGIISW